MIKKKKRRKFANKKIEKKIENDQQPRYLFKTKFRFIYHFYLHIDIKF